jgi:hypothetical protein
MAPAMSLVDAPFTRHIYKRTRERSLSTWQGNWQHGLA